MRNIDTIINEKMFHMEHEIQNNSYKPSSAETKELENELNSLMFSTSNNQKNNNNE